MNIVRLHQSGAEIFQHSSMHRTHRWINENGYVAITLHREGKDKIYFVHPKARMHEIDVKSH